MWPQRTYVPVPLLELSSDAPLVREPRQEWAFDEMKALLMHVNAYLALPFHSIPIQIQAIINWVRPLYWYLR